MALKKITIGSLTDFHQYDDESYDKAMIIEQPISFTGTPADPDDLVKLNTLANTLSSDAVIADNSIVRGDGGSRKIQDSAFYIDDNGNLYNDKVMLTIEGGVAIKLTNQTGSATVKGQQVKADTANNDAVVLTAVSDDECFGVFYEDGIADGDDTWIVVSGIADVAFEDNHGPTRGDWVQTSTTDAGYAYSQASPAAAPAHFLEIGHCIETVAAGGAGTHILARCVLHFN